VEYSNCKLEDFHGSRPALISAYIGKPCRGAASQLTALIWARLGLEAGPNLASWARLYEGGKWADLIRHQVA